MDPNRAKEKATGHPLRRALLDRLGGEERTLSELGGDGLPDDPSLSAVAYHLTVLQRAELVACIGGVYRVA